MKRLIFVFGLFMAISFFGYSQLEKGNVLLGGYSEISISSSYTAVQLNPNSGIFLNDNLCLSASLPLIYVQSNLYWGFTPFARYYFASGEKHSFFTSAALGVGYMVKADNSLDSAPLHLGIGHTWFLNESIGFEANFVGRTDFERMNFGILFGFQAYLNRQ